MKNLLAPPRPLQGNTLIMTVVVTALIGLVLAAYLTLVSHQNATNQRSQAWNSAIPVVEAGLEHALAHLNANIGADLARDGWTANGTTYVHGRTIGSDGYYVAVITNYFPGVNVSAPEVTAVAYVAAPLMAAAPVPGPFLAAVGVTTASQVSLIRGVHIRCSMDALFARGLVAKDNIDMNGNGVTTDSFDSMDPAHSNNGRYDPNKPRKAKGDIASTGGLVEVGNADIYGHVATGPNGSFSIGSGGRVGDTNWVPSGGTNVQPGWYANDLNFQVPDVQVPFTGGYFTPSGGTITNSSSTPNTNIVTTIPYPGGVTGSITTNTITSSTYPVGSPGPITTNYSKKGAITGYTYPTFSYPYVTYSTNNSVVSYDYILDDGNYMLTSLNGTVYVRGNAKLYVNGTTCNMTDMDIKPGNVFNLYSSAPSVSIGGNNSVYSDNTADAFTFWGLPTCTSISISGNGSFNGTIYAPQADMTLNGGGNNTVDLVGAAVVKSATLNGHFNFHYDEALARIGPSRGYIISTWDELNPEEIRQHIAGLPETYTPTYNQTTTPPPTQPPPYP